MKKQEHDEQDLGEEAGMLHVKEDREARMEDHLAIIGAAEARKERAAAAQQVQDAVNEEHARKLKEREDTSRFKDEADETSNETNELGEEISEESKVSAAVYEREAAATRRLRQYDNDAVDLKEAADAQESENIRDAQLLARHEQKIAVAEKTEAVRKEGIRFGIDEIEASKSAAIAKLTVEQDDEAKKTMRSQKVGMDEFEHTAAKERSSEIMSKFNLDAQESNILSNNAKLMDSNNKAQNVAYDYKRYVAGQESDVATAVDPVVMSEYTREQVAERKTLPTVQDAKISVDQNAFEHACDEIDKINNDPLCAMKNLKTPQNVQQLERAAEKGDDYVDIADDTVVALQVESGEGSEFVTLDAHLAEKEVGKEVRQQHREMADYSTRIDAAAEKVLDGSYNFEDSIGNRAWNHAQRVEKAEIEGGVVAENEEPAAVRSSTSKIIHNAIDKKNDMMSQNFQIVSGAVYKNNLENEASNRDLGNTILALNLREARRNDEATAILDNEMARRNVNVFGPSKGELARQNFERSEAAQGIRKQIRAFDRGLEAQKQRAKDRQDMEMRAMAVVHDEMATRQKALDHVISNAMGVN